MVEFRAEYENGILTLTPKSYNKHYYYFENFGPRWKLFYQNDPEATVKALGVYPSLEAAYSKFKEY